MVMGMHPVTLEVEAEDQKLRPAWAVYRETVLKHIYTFAHTQWSKNLSK